jgi:hypothetical protein
MGHPLVRCAERVERVTGSRDDSSVDTAESRTSNRTVIRTGAYPKGGVAEGPAILLDPHGELPFRWLIRL